MTHTNDHVFAAVEQLLLDEGLRIVSKDMDRPWGGFFVIDEAHAEAFMKIFFPGENPAQFAGKKISPKMLLVAPGMRLSWQYHHRRAELWRVYEGEVFVMMSDTDDETEPKKYVPGDLVRLKQGERHRLIGAEGWGIVAEIWQHTDPQNPSDENDIVRVQDDFGRG